jgi:hypothetical protein
LFCADRHQTAGREGEMGNCNYVNRQLQRKNLWRFLVAKGMGLVYNVWTSRDLQKSVTFSGDFWWYLFINFRKSRQEEGYGRINVPFRKRKLLFGADL